MVLDWNRVDEDLFWGSAKERHEMFLKRGAGKPAPWTEDSILNHARTCLPFRTLDRHTIEMFNLAQTLDPDEQPLFVAFARRNCRREIWPKCIEAIKTNWVDGLGEELKRLEFRGEKTRTGRYIACSPKDSDLSTACRVAEVFEDARWDNARQLADCLVEVQWTGPFLAWQHALDWGICSEKDWDQWTNCKPILGPGAFAGAKLLGADKKEALQLCAALASRAKTHGPINVDMPMMIADVEHWLCEFQKLVRAAKGGAVRPYKIGE